MYWLSISLTSNSAASSRVFFFSGISMSFTPNEMPARVAVVKPACMSLSAKITVSRRPQRRNDALISLEISFFLRALLISGNGRPGGRISDRSARPIVVS